MRFSSLLAAGAIALFATAGAAHASIAVGTYDITVTAVGTDDTPGGCAALSGFGIPISTNPLNPESGAFTLILSNAGGFRNKLIQSLGLVGVNGQVTYFNPPGGGWGNPNLAPTLPLAGTSYGTSAALSPNNGPATWNYAPGNITVKFVKVAKVNDVGLQLNNVYYFDIIWDEVGVCHIEGTGLGVLK
jgi:hypothetical protein